MSDSKPLDVAQDHPSYAGHFPNFPVLPGAVLLNEVFEVLGSERGVDLQDWRIASAKFLGTVRPGDALRVEFDADTPGAIRFSVLTEERKVLSGVLHER